MADEKKTQPERIEHTRGGPSTRDDATDLGAPMQPAADPKAERVGPEDALDPEGTRGDYSGLTGPPSYTSQVVGMHPDGSPKIEMVRQTPKQKQ